MRKEILITNVTPAEEPIFKTVTNTGRLGFGINVLYTLEDGQTIKSTIARERKKNVLPAIERERQSIAAKAMTANFNDAGEFWGTTTRYNLF